MAFWLLNMSPFRRTTSWGIPDIETPEEKADLDRTWNILRFARVKEGEWFPALSERNWITTAEEKHYVNAHRCPDGLLLNAVNWSDEDGDLRIGINDASTIGLESDARYLVYEPRSQSLVYSTPQTLDQLREFNLEVPALGFRSLWLREVPDNPEVLYTLGSDGLESAQWDNSGRVLTITPKAPEGAPLTVTVYNAGLIPTLVETSDNGRPGFRHERQSNLVHFQTTYSRGLKLMVNFR
jgi:hypothetical protein